MLNITSYANLSDGVLAQKIMLVDIAALAVTSYAAEPASARTALASSLWYRGERQSPCCCWHWLYACCCFSGVNRSVAARWIGLGSLFCCLIIFSVAALWKMARSDCVCEPSSAGGGTVVDRVSQLYPSVDEDDNPLPRQWSAKDKFNFLGLSQNNLRVHYKGWRRRRVTA